MATLKVFLEEHGFLCNKTKLKNYGGEYLYIFSPEKADVHPSEAKKICDYLKSEGWKVYHKKVPKSYFHDGHVIQAFKWDKEPVLGMYGELREHIYKPKFFKKTCAYISDTLSAEYAAEMNVDSFLELQEIKYALERQGITIKPRFLEEVKRIDFMVTIPKITY